MIRPDQSRAEWRKSSYSTDQGNCVEVAIAHTGVGVRDSKNVNGPTLMFDGGVWQTFVRSAR